MSDHDTYRERAFDSSKDFHNKSSDEDGGGTAASFFDILKYGMLMGFVVLLGYGASTKSGQEFIDKIESERGIERTSMEREKADAREGGEY